MWPLAVLMGDHINGIFYKEMYGHFAGPIKKVESAEQFWRNVLE